MTTQAPGGEHADLPAPANGATATAWTVLDELVRCGVRHVVLSPGSRSAPLALAAHALAGAGRLVLHTRLDERTAGFVALGLARGSHGPVAVVTTSGTAVANLHPATLEARHAGVPLVLVTADRPSALRGTGANQTTLQPGIFAGAVLADADVPPAAPGSDEDGQVRAWRALTARLVGAATGAGRRARGPVHLNLQLAGALTPDVSDGWSAPLRGRAGGAPWASGGGAPGPRPSPELPALPAPEPAGRLDRGPLTVVVAGDDAGPPARMLAEAAGWPLLAEPSSGSRTGSHAIRTYRLLLGDPDLAERVERVVVCGHPTLARPVMRLLSGGAEVVAVASRATRTWTDPGHAAAVLLDEVPAPPEAPATGREVSWLEEWRMRDTEVSRRLDELVAGRDLTGLAVAAAVAGALPPRGLLLVGASNPVRDLDLMVPRYRVGDRRLVLANRGLAGIDGTVSTALGAALGRPHSGRALALMGDVTFLHDATGLLLGPHEPRPDLTLVVVNDDGGSIFSLLEQGAPEFAASFERVFATPHGVDLQALCAASGTPHTRVTDHAGLAAALETARAGIHVVEAVVRRDGRRALDAEVRALATA